MPHTIKFSHILHDEDDNEWKRCHSTKPWIKSENGVIWRLKNTSYNWWLLREYRENYLFYEHKLDSHTKEFSM